MRRKSSIALSEAEDSQQVAPIHAPLSKLDLIEEDDMYWQQHETIEIRNIQEQILFRKVEAGRLRWLLTRFLVGSAGAVQVICGLISLVFRQLGLEVISFCRICYVYLLCKLCSVVCDLSSLPGLRPEELVSAMLFGCMLSRTIKTGKNTTK